MPCRSSKCGLASGAGTQPIVTEVWAHRYVLTVRLPLVHCHAHKSRSYEAMGGGGLSQLHIK